MRSLVFWILIMTCLTTVNTMNATAKLAVRLDFIRHILSIIPSFCLANSGSPGMSFSSII